MNIGPRVVNFEGIDISHHRRCDDIWDLLNVVNVFDGGRGSLRSLAEVTEEG